MRAQNWAFARLISKQLSGPIRQTTSLTRYRKVLGKKGVTNNIMRNMRFTSRFGARAPNQDRSSDFLHETERETTLYVARQCTILLSIERLGISLHVYPSLGHTDYCMATILYRW